MTELENKPGSGVPSQLTPGPAEIRPLSVTDSLKFSFHSPGWKLNLLLASALRLVPFLGSAVIRGWTVEIHQRLQKKHPTPIPNLKMKDLFGYLRRGWIPSLTFYFARIILAVFSYLAFLVFSTGSILGAIALDNLTPLVITAVGGSLLYGLLLMVGAVILNAIVTRLEITERSSEALSARNIFIYGKKTWGMVWRSLAWLLPIMLVLSLAGLGFCLLGLLPVLVIWDLTGTHLRWQIHQQFLLRGGRTLLPPPAAKLPSATHEEHDRKVSIRASSRSI